MTKLSKDLMDMHEEIQSELKCLKSDIELINARMNEYENWYNNMADSIKGEK